MLDMRLPAMVVSHLRDSFVCTVKSSKKTLASPWRIYGKTLSHRHAIVKIRDTYHTQISFFFMVHSELLRKQKLTVFFLNEKLNNEKKRSIKEK